MGEECCGGVPNMLGTPQEAERLRGRRKRFRKNPGGDLQLKPSLGADLPTAEKKRKRGGGTGRNVKGSLSSSASSRCEGGGREARALVFVASRRARRDPPSIAQMVY